MATGPADVFSSCAGRSAGRDRGCCLGRPPDKDPHGQDGRDGKGGHDPERAVVAAEILHADAGDGGARALGRGCYERVGSKGHWHGKRGRQLLGSFGPMMVEVPRAVEGRTIRRRNAGLRLRSSQPMAARHQREHQRAAAPVLPKRHRSQRAQRRGDCGRGGRPQFPASKDACLENSRRST